MKKLTFAMCVLLAGSPWAYAETATTAAATGDVEQGKAKSAVCASCHGMDGNTPIAPIYPKIAGQHSKYMANQLAKFKDGSRNEPTMASQAMGLSDQDMLDLGAYYASLPGSEGTASETSIEAGQKLYLGGNTMTGVSACAACHGPRGSGNPAAAYPSISGQSAGYTLQQLKNFKMKTRGADANATIMNDIAARMTDEEMQTIADYVAGLH